MRSGPSWRWYRDRPVVLMAAGVALFVVWIASAPLWWDVDFSLMTPLRLILAYTVYPAVGCFALGLVMTLSDR
jgi:hypothetical protein